MFTKKSQVRIYVPELLHKADEAELIKEFSGLHNIPYSNIKVFTKEVKNLSETIEKKIEENRTSDNTSDLYEGYLKDKEYNKELFQQLDKEISLEVDFAFNERKNYKLKYISGYNLTSYGEVTFNFEEHLGTIGLFSNPPNFGGKSNLYKLIQILLWGKYLSLDEYSNLSNLFNDYIKDTYAFIEGSLEMDNKYYYIRRELRKETKKRVKQTVFTYQICDEYNADKYVYIFDNTLKEIEKRKYNPSLPDGMWVKTMDKNETAALFDSIGSIEDFVKICLFNQHTLYNLILTKKTERTRNFYSLFGGEYYEKKKNIAKEKYAEFKKRASLHRVALLDLQKEVSDNEAKSISLKQEFEHLIAEIKSLNNSILVLEREKVQQYEKLLPIREYNVIGKNKEIISLESDIEILNEKINNIKENLKNYVELEGMDKEELEEKYNSYLKKLGTISEDSELNAIVNQQNIIVSDEKEKLSNINDNLNEIARKKTQIKDKFTTNKDNISFYEKELTTIPEDIKCPECNTAVINYSSKREEMSLKIAAIKNQNINLKAEGTSLVATEQDFLNKKKIIEDNLQQLDLKINDVKRRINEKINQERTTLNDKIEKLALLLKQLGLYKEQNEKKLRYEYDLSSKTNILENLKKEIETYIKDNEEALKHNQGVKSDIEEIEFKLKEKNRILSFHVEKKGNLSANIERLDKEIGDTKSKIDSYAEEIELDKAYQFYIETHDMNGIVKYMIESYLSIINRELNSLTEHMGFNVEIFLDGGKYINYNFIRDGKIRDLKNVSGCEGYVALTALYLVHIKFSKISLPNIVLFDEVFNQIADENIENVYEILKLYGEVFDNVFIISHGRILETLVDYNVFIEKDLKTNISKILN